MVKHSSCMSDRAHASYVCRVFLSMVPVDAPYTQPHILRDPISNNALSYRERRALGSTGHLRVAARHHDPHLELRERDAPAFEEVEEGGLITCFGLDTFPEMLHPETGAPITVVDNHNHALYFWAEAHVHGHIPWGVTLVHVDQHKDMRRPRVLLPAGEFRDLPAVYAYVNREVNVGSFIVPALEAGLVGKVHMLDSDFAFAKAMIPDEPFILDIDLDVFARDLEYMDRDRMRDVLRDLMPKARCITIATSPYFLPFSEAKHWLAVLLEDAGLRG